ncbi:V-set domain-containing T-cell activation inhibitor 1 [Osmerus eperlanus]|uniref:V-set domain-containing T-cell activation inhibitor 1 n=1 Tax=Osmerus eperlanus TaxID=29151 RepID=UPI002E0D3A5C
MSSIGQIIFYSMVVLIIVFSALIIIFLSIAGVRGTQGSVESNDTSPVGNLGEDVVLSCSLTLASASDVAITWTKKGLSGVVYRYANGAAQLEEQNAQFRDRTQLFTSAAATGSASLLLSSVRVSDEGQYICSVSASRGRGMVTIHLRVAAFSAPTFLIEGVDILTAKAQKWSPKPNVTWMEFNGKILNGNTSFSNNSAGIYNLVSSLQPVTNSTYSCLIQNSLVKAFSEATIKGTEIFERTAFVYTSTSTSLRPELLSVKASFILWICQRG